MTPDQAYNVIGVSRNSSRSQIEQAYKSKLNSLQRQMQTGQPLAVREQAKRQVAELVNAWDLLKNAPRQGHKQPPVNRRQPQHKPAPSSARQQSRTRNWSGSSSTPPLPNRAVVMSFVLAAVMMLAVIFLCTAGPAASEPTEPAQLRVLSYPWCYVTVDGKWLGASGQLEAFEFEEGIHKLTFKRDHESLTRNMRLSAGHVTVMKVQFEKGQIDVIYK